jgi:hypothetical protein
MLNFRQCGGMKLNSDIAKTSPAAIWYSQNPNISDARRAAEAQFDAWSNIKLGT